MKRNNWALYLLLTSFSQNYVLATYTTHVLSVNFIHNWRQLQFSYDSEEPSIQSIRQKTAKKKPQQKYYFDFVYVWTTGSHLISQHNT